jgi:hypothetical protein
MGKPYRRNVLSGAVVPSSPPIVMWDDMESLLKWQKTGTGADYTVTLDDTKCFNGNYSLYMVTKSTTPAAADEVVAYRYFGIRQPRFLTVRFLAKLLSTYQYLQGPQLLVEVFTQSLLHRFGFTVDQSTAEVKLYDANGNYNTAVTLTGIAPSDEWSLYEVSVNLITQQYASLYAYANEIDVAGQSYHVDTPAGNKGGGAIVLKAIALDAYQVGYNVDNVMISEDIW